MLVPSKQEPTDFHGAGISLPAFRTVWSKQKQATALSKIHIHPDARTFVEQLTRKKKEIFYIGVTHH